MPDSKYLKLGGNDQIIVDIEKLPEKAFIDAVKHREIAAIKVSDRETRKRLKPGSPDIMLCKPSGQTRYISRKELIEKYTMANGKKIVIPFLKDNTLYYVARNCNEQCKAMKLADNLVGVFKGANVKKGSYIVCDVNEDGSINIESLEVISPAMFRKQYKIPMQAIISRHSRDGGSKNIPTNRRDNRVRLGGPIPISVKQPARPNMRPATSNNMAASQQGRPQGRNNINLNQLNPAAANRTSNIVQAKIDQTKYRYQVTARLVSMQDNTKTMGFEIQDLQSGQKRNITENQLKSACSQKLVKNIMLVTREDGFNFLKGNGIEMNNLPKYLV